MSSYNEDNYISLVRNIAEHWFHLNKTEQGVAFIESAINLESLKPSKKFCTLLINFGVMLGNVAKYERGRLMFERSLKITEEQNFKSEHVLALYNFGVLYYDLGYFESSISI